MRQNIMDVLYTYDAWGVPTFHNQIPIIGTSVLGKLTHVMTGMLYERTNQLTYRGYFYDFETGLYYLQSRYYAPNWGRFINADKHFDTGTGLLGTNLYIYCDDNPIMFVDPTGEGVLTGLDDFKDITMYVDDKKTVTATDKWSKESLNPVRYWVWTSSCPDIAYVNSSTKTVTVEARSVGTATITLTVYRKNNKENKESFTVTVKPKKFAAIRLKGDSADRTHLHIYSNATKLVYARIGPAQQVKWSSENKNMLTVSNTGAVNSGSYVTITGKSTRGTTMLTVKGVTNTDVKKEIPVTTINDTANWSGVMNSDQFIRLTKPDTKSAYKLTKNSIIEVLGEVNTYYYISAVVNSKTQWGFVPKTEVLKPVTVPAGSQIQRGAPVKYLAMGIGWPLGKVSGGNLVEDRSAKKIISNFGPRTGAGSPHLGIDLIHPTKESSGIPVLAVCKAKVIDVGYNSASMGNYISIQATNLLDPATGNPLIFTYMHMKGYAIVAEGTTVQKGQKIGEVGGTGAVSQGTHLHFECSNFTTPHGYSAARSATGNTSDIIDRKKRAYNRVNPEFFYPAGSFTYNTDTDGIWHEKISLLNGNGS
jgi:RHS repeat-associated protein